MYKTNNIGPKKMDYHQWSIGDVIDNKLTFNQHISEKINKANSIMGVLRRTMEYMHVCSFVGQHSRIVEIYP
jgi:hypothetical protein